MAFSSYTPEILTNVVAAILVISFGILVGNILSILGKKILHSFDVERLLQMLGVSFPIEEFLGSIIKYGIYIIGLILGVTFLGLDSFFLYAILFLILGILILFILLSFNVFIPNFIAGLAILIKGKLQKGDYIEIDTIEGKVIHMDMLEVKIRTMDGDVVIVPNVLILRQIITKKKK